MTRMLQDLPTPAALRVLCCLDEAASLRAVGRAVAALWRPQAELGGGRSAVEEAAAELAGRRDDSLRQLAPLQGSWLDVLWELEALERPRRFTRCHADLSVREDGAVAVHRGARGGTAVCAGVAMRAGVHSATFTLLWRGARVGIVASRGFDPTGELVWATGSSYGWAYDSASGKCFHAEHGSGRRFEKDQAIEWAGSEVAEKGDTIRLTLDFGGGTLEVAKNGKRLGVMCCGTSFRHWLWQSAGCCWAAEVWNSAVRIDQATYTTLE